MLDNHEVEAQEGSPISNQHTVCQQIKNSPDPEKTMVITLDSYLIIMIT